jgi:glycosyltransferase involved in cell wall biosynthesis
MKILVLGSFPPLLNCRGTEIFDDLIANLRLEGIQAEGFRIPFSREPAEHLVEEMAIVRRIRMSNVDRVIALNFPAYLVYWPAKVLWLMHQHREAYDLRDEGKSNIGVDLRGQQLAAAIRTSDRLAFSESQKIHTFSSITSRRLMEYNAVSSSVLHPPISRPELFWNEDSDGYVFAPGKVCRSNRQHLLIRALRHLPRVRLVIAGPADMEEAGFLWRLVDEEKAGDRVTLDLRHLSRADLARFVNHCLAVAWLPSEEDPLGIRYIPEAFEAGKPVLTTSDTTDALEFVRDAETGVVVEPQPEALGHGMAVLADDPAMATRLGRAAYDLVRTASLNWPAVIKRLAE